MYNDDERNLTLLADFYEFTMANGYLENDMADTIAYFDMYYRDIPDEGGFAIAAGLEQVVHYIQNLHYTEEDIAFLRKKGIFSDQFLNYLKDFTFTSDIWALPEGSVVFPGEPMLIARGPVLEVQMIETMVLLSLNHQSLIATKANRIVRASEGRAVMEFGSRRAQGPDAATLGARAAFIGGVVGTANTYADRLYNVPALGTMAHSWVQMFPTELDAFKAYARSYPDACVLLVDTYNTLKDGVPNAIKAFDEVLKPLGKRPLGIRLDSGDIAYLSKKARKMLDAAGYEDCPIVASNSLDEHKIRDILNQGAKLNSFGVGESLITARSQPIFGGVYKLVAIEDSEGNIQPKIKISENVEKITTPGFKNIYRLYDRATGKAEADLITLADETIDDTKDLEIFHPTYTWKRKTLSNFNAKPLLVPIFKEGKLVYDLPSLVDINDFCRNEVHSLWDEIKRFDNPHLYIVDLSYPLWELKHTMLQEAKH